MRKALIALVATGLCFSPAFSQTKTPAGQQKSMADCQANFKAADKDGNGTLSQGEMKSSSKVVPTSLASRNSVTQQDFLTACNMNRPKGG
jgi:hypothetical protein